MGSALNIQYNFSATQNNGKVTSQTDVISGEQIVYTYDALNRLATAQTAGAGGWGQSYTYDGFGNLTDQTVIKGSAPDVHVAYNASNNRQTGDTADANGNIGYYYFYDLDNRLVQPGTSYTTQHFGYDVENKRVWRGDSSGLNELAFWAGKKLATYQISSDGGGFYFTLTSTNVYLGGKLLSKGTYNSSGTGDKVTLAPVAADRLGSIGKFYPYGVERPSATGNDTEKFTGYFRDQATGLDYADQRYEQPGAGRFMTTDSAAPASKDPGSFNRYAYVGGDSINYTDSTGRLRDKTVDCSVCDQPNVFDDGGVPFGGDFSTDTDAWYGTHVQAAGGGWNCDPNYALALQRAGVPSSADNYNCGQSPFAPVAYSRVPLFAKFVGAASASFDYASECGGNTQGAFASVVFQILDQTGTPFAVGGLQVQEQISNDLETLSDGTVVPFGGSGWRSTRGDGPSYTTASGTFIDTPFGGCSDFIAMSTHDQQYRVNYAGSWYYLSPTFHFTMIQGPASIFVASWEFSFRVSR